ncbi:MAG: hypothetical protein EBR82_52605 [Caulobacteraceae bacterium]|nr:hypothetical protein [Caulobacteraceae bacterium]
MADIKIKDLPAAAAVGTSVVPVMTANGSATNAVTLAAVAALGGGPPALHAASHAAGAADAITPNSIGAAIASHAHGAITSDGKVGSAAGIPLVTGAGGAITAGEFGNGSGTFCQGNDSRLSNPRTPTSHAATHATGAADPIAPADIGAATSGHVHGNITSAGQIGTTSGLPIMTSASGLLVAGAFGASAGTVCQGNDARLSDSRTPNTHAASHASGGSDAVTLAISQVTNLQTLLDGKVASNVTGIAGAVAITNVVKVTQAQYDAIASPSATTLYVIVAS